MSSTFKPIKWHISMLKNKIKTIMFGTLDEVNLNDKLICPRNTIMKISSTMWHEVPWHFVSNIVRSHELSLRRYNMYFWLLYHVVCTQYGMRYHVHNMSVGPCYPDLLHPWCRINVLNHPQMSILHATRLVGHFGTLGRWSWHHPPVLW